jgi:hypothetical protein
MPGYPGAYSKHAWAGHIRNPGHLGRVVLALSGSTPGPNTYLEGCLVRRIISPLEKAGRSVTAATSLIRTSDGSPAYPAGRALTGTVEWQVRTNSRPRQVTGSLRMDPIMTGR